jgi:hypothetical protein
LPTPIVLHNSRQPNHPWCEVDVNKGHVWAEEEGSFRVADFDDLGDCILQLLRILSLLGELLSLEELIEERNDLSINLSRSVDGTTPAQF